MSYNGIGLSTARGSGTNGYVQKNMSSLYTSQKSGNYARRQEMRLEDERNIKKVKGGLGARKLDQDILDHNNKRKVEVKCFELQVELEDDGKLTSEEIEVKVDELRRKLTLEQEQFAAQRNNSGRFNNRGKGNGWNNNQREPQHFKGHEIHDMAKAKKEENERMRRAFNLKPDEDDEIDKYYDNNNNNGTNGNFRGDDRNLKRGLRYDSYVPNYNKNSRSRSPPFKRTRKGRSRSLSHSSTRSLSRPYSRSPSQSRTRSRPPTRSYSKRDGVYSMSRSRSRHRSQSSSKPHSSRHLLRTRSRSNSRDRSHHNRSRYRDYHLTNKPSIDYSNPRTSSVHRRGRTHSKQRISPDTNTKTKGSSKGSESESRSDSKDVRLPSKPLPTNVAALKAQAFMKQLKSYEF